MPVVFDQVDAEVAGDRPARADGENRPAEAKAQAAASADEVLREVAREARLAERVKAD